MDNLEFQLIDIDFDDICVNQRPEDLRSDDCMSRELRDSMKNGELYPPREFVLTLYGITKDGQKIVCVVYNYHPYFYADFSLKGGIKKEDIEKYVFNQYVNRSCSRWKFVYSAGYHNQF